MSNLLQPQAAASSSSEVAAASVLTSCMRCTCPLTRLLNKKCIVTAAPEHAAARGSSLGEPLLPKPTKKPWPGLKSAQRWPASKAVLLFEPRDALGGLGGCRARPRGTAARGKSRHARKHLFLL